MKQLGYLLQPVGGLTWDKSGNQPTNQPTDRGGTTAEAAAFCSGVHLRSSSSSFVG